MAATAGKKEPILFTWEGIDKSGKRVKGEQSGRTEVLVKAQLRQQGIKPIKVKKKPKSLLGGRTKKITTKDIAVFSRQLATMMGAGVPLVQAFDIVGRGHENPGMQKLILTIKDDIESGNTLTEALRKHPLYFDELFCNLVEAGEQAGVLETLLDKIATYKEKTESLKAKVKKALTYPAAVIVVACIVTSILLIFVVPQFEELFKGFGADLPAFTQLVINLSRFMQANWYYLFGAIGIAIYLFFYFKKRSKKFNRLLDRLFLKIPIVGPQILHKSAIARFSRTLSTMSAAGVPLVEALESVAGASGNAVYSDAILEMRESVATGQQLQQTMRQTGLFPHMVVQMVAIGEESGSIDSMLAKVADFYEEEVDNAVDALSSLMEPMIMAFLGIVVGGLVVAMYLPIFKLGAVV
ncbi:type II secretion system F family protein [Methylohalobius crimeensis]|uniref:type II secretion system F family protein n=1 Tax=Methylohalobius crimeensis TaxID=244365 RepID=UPI0003B6D603|nr:type II secretion system F family protein [Methylohalobius crimeensis]